MPNSLLRPVSADQLGRWVLQGGFLLCGSLQDTLQPLKDAAAAFGTAAPPRMSKIILGLLE